MPQAVPQPPQFEGSELVSVQVLPQATSVPGQDAQAPSAHRPLPQTWPQPPQSKGSEPVSVQPPLQSVAPPLQAWQLPAMQLCPPQSLPHPPQFDESLLVSVQLLPQASCPPAHGRQTPPAQTLTALHSFPQAPQLKGSTARSVAPVQAGGGPVSTEPPTQVEARQTCRSEQAWSQPPQFFTSSVVSVQSWPQAVRSREPGW